MASGHTDWCGVSLMRSGNRVVIGRLPLRFVLASALAFAMLLALASTAFGATFDPALVISNDNMRASDSMTQADVQAFLNTQAGPLKTLVATDHLGKKKPAAQIIVEACRASHISPKVMLVMLQKEQGLISSKSFKYGLQYALDWAVGCGVPDTGGRTAYAKGFGNQLWNGAAWLSNYGETPGYHGIDLYKAGMTYGPVKPKNLATYKLYVYNPSIGAKPPYGDLSSQAKSLSGNANFWHLYWKYFGDPFADPQVKVVYRFQNKSNGGFYYTSSPADKYRFQSSKYWRYNGAAFSWNTTTTATATQTINSVSVYRFFNRKKATYLYTSSATKVAKLRSAKYSRTYRYEGEAWRVTPVATKTTNVFCFLSKKNATYLYTSSPREKAKYLSAANKKKYRFTGAFHVVQ